MTMTANVTQADIHEGVRNDPCKCPIARSLKRKYKLKVEVFWNYIQITRRGTTTLYPAIQMSLVSSSRTLMHYTWWNRLVLTSKR
jgi:hypothetical protein